jgi:predicted HTH transcriptional regulator
MNEIVSEMSSSPPHQISQSIDKLLQQGESDFLEFKASMLHLYPSEKKYKSRDGNSDISENTTKMLSAKKETIQREIATAIIAFSNSKGGIIIIGVDDNGKVLGIENDYKEPELSKKKDWDDNYKEAELSKKKDWDNWVLHFRNNVLSKYIKDKLIWARVKITKEEVEDKTIAIIYVPERLGSYLYVGNEIEFYIRTLHSSEKLNPKESHQYLREREKEQSQPML